MSAGTNCTKGISSAKRASEDFAWAVPISIISNGFLVGMRHSRAGRESTRGFEPLCWNGARRDVATSGREFSRSGTLEKAQKECLADADLREARRRREAIRNEQLDQKFVAAFASKIRKRYPKSPSAVETRVAEHACAKYSGRVGRTAAAKALEPETVDLAVQAHVRHELTDYDDHLSAGMERREARALVGRDVARILREWSDI